MSHRTGSNYSRMGVREAKANFSRLLKRVQAGGEVLITDRDVPVAKIVPVDDEPLPLEKRLESMEKDGLIGPPPRKRGKMPAPLPLPGGLAQRFLREEREQS
ncbi:MAG: type II toxin-antitoxin system prevent-host-death family antitoxin [Bacillota bacterium]